MSCGQAQTDSVMRRNLGGGSKNHNSKILYLGVRACLLKDSVEIENVNTGSYCVGCHSDGVVVSNFSGDVQGQ